MKQPLIILATILTALALAACDAQGATFEIQGQLQGPYEVHRVTDGDTLRVYAANDAGETISIPVRLIGIDTPEITNGKMEAYGPEAAEYLTTLVQAGRVYLELDIEAYDRYDRLLAYVYVPDATGYWLAPDGSTYTQANHAIALTGLAQPLTIQPNSRYANAYAAAVQAARDAKRGMWADL